MNTTSSANQVQKNNADSDSNHEVKNDVAYRDGFHFYFQYQAYTIHAFGSAILGIEFNMVNSITGELHCSLIKDGAHLKTLKRALKKSNHLTVTNVLRLLFLSAGIGIGFMGTLVLGEVAGLWNIDTVISYFN